MFQDPQVLLEGGGALELAPRTIDIWSFDLTASSTTIESCQFLLAEQERRRAERFSHGILRDQYVIVHAVLRSLLGRYCGCPSKQLHFVVGAAGKPALQGGTVSFNLTHAGGRAMVALGDGGDVGIDLEQVRADVEVLDIANGYFFGGEHDAILAAPASRQSEVFFRYWVAKEAVLKAQGLGLGFPLDSFVVQFSAAGDEASVKSFEPQRLSDAWTIRMLPCTPGWCAAVAASGHDWRIRVRA